MGSSRIVSLVGFPDMWAVNFGQVFTDELLLQFQHIFSDFRVISESPHFVYFLHVNANVITLIGANRKQRLCSRKS